MYSLLKHFHLTSSLFSRMICWGILLSHNRILRLEDFTSIGSVGSTQTLESINQKDVYLSIPFQYMTMILWKDVVPLLSGFEPALLLFTVCSITTTLLMCSQKKVKQKTPAQSSATKKDTTAAAAASAVSLLRVFRFHFETRFPRFFFRKKPQPTVSRCKRRRLLLLQRRRVTRPVHTKHRRRTTRETPRWGWLGGEGSHCTLSSPSNPNASLFQPAQSKENASQKVSAVSGKSGKKTNVNEEPTQKEVTLSRKMVEH